MRNDIIFGTLKPNAKLRLEALRERYGPSIPTLREVLSRLATEGFVVTEGQKGFRVATVSVNGLREVADMRQLIESKALTDSIANGGLDWEATIVAAHHRLATLERAMISAEEADVRLWKQYDREFHTALISACRSAFLLRVYGEVYSHYLRYQMQALGFRGESSAQEHRQLLELTLKRDAEGAVASLARHISVGVEHAASSGVFSGDDEG